MCLAAENFIDGRTDRTAGKHDFGFSSLSSIDNVPSNGT